MAHSPSIIRPRALWLAAIAAAVTLAAVALRPVTADAAASAFCNPNGFALTAGGKTYQGAQKGRVPLAAGQRIQLDGRFADFTVDADTFRVENYRLTSSLTNGRTVQIFASKTPNGTRLNGDVEFELRADSLVLLRKGNIKMKVQAKDCEQGGIFQLEADSPVTMTHTLGAGDRLSPFVYPADQAGTGRLCFTDRTSVNGYDSPQFATRTGYDAATGTSQWSVAAGGRLGMVLGEDAVQSGCNV
jgi:hypothetical protein